jgi:hypothetical protein
MCGGGENRARGTCWRLSLHCSNIIFLRIFNIYDGDELLSVTGNTYQSNNRRPGPGKFRGQSRMTASMGHRPSS